MRTFSFCAALLVVTWTASAFAGDAQTAEALFQSGKEALARGDLSVACARLAESLRLDPAVGTTLNLAECERRAGKLAAALAHYQAARDRLVPSDFRTNFVSERIAELGPRVPRLTIRIRTSRAPDVTVLRDGTVLGDAALGVALPVDPGTHVIVVRARGHADACEEVTLREGDVRVVDLERGPALASERASPPSAPSAPSATQRTLGIVLGGVGVAGVGVGTVFGIVSKSTYDEARTHCSNGPDSCDAIGVSRSETAYGQAAASTVALIAGGALLASGLALFLTAPRSLAVAPSASANQAGLAIGGRW